MIKSLIKPCNLITQLATFTNWICEYAAVSPFEPWSRVRPSCAAQGFETRIVWLSNRLQTTHQSWAFDDTERRQEVTFAHCRWKSVRRYRITQAASKWCLARSLEDANTAFYLQIKQRIDKHPGDVGRALDTMQSLHAYRQPTSRRSATELY